MRTSLAWPRLRIRTESFLRRRYSCSKQSYACRLRSSESATSRRVQDKEEEDTHLFQSVTTALGSCGLHCSCAVVLTRLNKWCAAALCTSPQQTRVSELKTQVLGSWRPTSARILKLYVLGEQGLCSHPFHRSDIFYSLKQGYVIH